MIDLDKLTIEQAKKDIENKEYNSVELMKTCIDRIEKNNKLNCFITKAFDQALENAKQADERYKNNTQRKLEGLPIGVKDLFCTKGVKTTNASKILENFVPTYESTVTENLFASGAISPGKLNMDEFAMGSSNTNSAYGDVINPIKSNNDDKNYVPGGSSGGSSASVAANMVLGSLGSDTGGSIRQPASYTATVGVKPSYGRCSRYGMIAFASSLDQAGAFAKNTKDAAMILESIMSHDLKDSTSSSLAIPNISENITSDLKGKKIGIPKEYMVDGMPAEISKMWENTANLLKENGAEIIDISLPTTKYALACYYIIACAEASSNLARYDGIKYGLRVFDDKMNLDELYNKTRSEGFGEEVKRRILLGTYVLSAGYFDAYYKKAQKVRRLICDDFKSNFEKVDAILTPTTPSAAFAIGEKEDDPVKMYLNDVLTVPASLAGLPALSLPAGYSSNNMPLGMQLITNRFQELELFQIAHQMEQIINFDHSKLEKNIVR